MTSLIYFYLWKNSEPCKAYSDDKNHGFKMSKECAKVLKIFINEHHVELQQRLIQDLLSVSTLWYGGEVTTIFMKLPMVSREKTVYVRTVAHPESLCSVAMSMSLS